MYSGNAQALPYGEQTVAVLWRLSHHILISHVGATRKAFQCAHDDGALPWLDQGAHVLFLTDGAIVFALDPTTQEFLWQNPFAEHSIILYRNGILLIPAYKQIYGVNAANGAQVWSQSVFASAISMNDSAAFMHISDPYEGNLYAVATATGKALWTSKTISVVGPTYATETSMYALSGLSATQPVTVQALSAATGALQWQVDPHSEYSSGGLVVG